MAALVLWETCVTARDSLVLKIKKHPPPPPITFFLILSVKDQQRSGSRTLHEDIDSVFACTFPSLPCGFSHTETIIKAAFIS